mmetsp:Transcript_17655/g.57727  ORF Transcript_17655/g.57727 Transcript_17655/m.57727 type:complete len:332 (+) Transcript_17655:1297-2292(+)
MLSSRLFSSSVARRPSPPPPPPPRMRPRAEGRRELSSTFSCRALFSSSNAPTCLRSAAVSFGSSAFSFAGAAATTAEDSLLLFAVSSSFSRRLISLSFALSPLTLSFASASFVWSFSCSLWSASFSASAALACSARSASAASCALFCPAACDAACFHRLSAATEGPPESSTFRARAANWSDVADSCAFPRAGPMLTNKSVFDSDPSESMRRCVSFEFRNGTCPFREVRLAMTSPSAERLLLMCRASLSRSPSASVLLRRSEPARSTRESLARCVAPVTRCRISTWIAMHRCERELRSFIFVAPVLRFFIPLSMTRLKSSGFPTSSDITSVT